MTPVVALTVLGALCAGAWWITRGLRKPWYPRFMVEILIVSFIALSLAVGYAGAAYEREHANMGEPEY